MSAAPGRSQASSQAIQGTPQGSGRLRTELSRLFGSDGVHPMGHTRVLMLGVTGADAWQRLGPVWQAVQTEWEWPAPAIAVDGQHGFQLWFSLAEAVDISQAARWLPALCQRHLADLPAARRRCWPDLSQPDAAPPPLPPVPTGPDRWSAFLAPDLATLFSDTPWLDLAPGADAQADLLARLHSVPAQAWARSLAGPSPSASDVVPAETAPPPQAANRSAALVYDPTDPRAFLLAVMNDTSAPLAQRIEAAKALLRD